MSPRIGCIAPILALALATAPGAARAQEKPPPVEGAALVRGKVFPILVAGKEPARYSCYLPAGYDPKRRYPVLYGFAPEGDGRALAERWAPVAEKAGWVVVCSRDFHARRTRPDQARALAERMIRHAEARFSLHPRRAVATGFDGGARMATGTARFFPKKFAGIIAVGGFAFPLRQKHPAHLSVFAVAGEKDRALRELRYFRSLLKKQGVRFELRTFSGGHEDAPLTLLSEAARWMNRDWVRHADDPDTRPARLALARKDHAAMLKKRQAGDLVGAYVAGRDFVRTFANTTDPALKALVEEVRRSNALLEKAPAVAGLKAFQAAEAFHAKGEKTLEHLRAAQQKYRRVQADFPGTHAARRAGQAVAAIERYIARRKMTLRPPKVGEVVAAFLRVAEAEQRSRDDPDALARLIPETLARISPDFRRALQLFDVEDYSGAEKLLKPLADRRDAAPAPYLAAYAQYYLARGYVLQERYEKARDLLDRLTGEALAHTAHSADALFLLGVCEAHLFERDVAVVVLRRFLDAYPDVPERMAVGARSLIGDLTSVEEGDLADIQARMDDSRRLLHLVRTGKKTQQQQEKIVAMLDALIEDLENQESGGYGSGAKESTARASSPDIGPLNRISRGTAEDFWGAARTRERRRVLNLLQQRFPERYRELVEQYFKSLQEE